MVAHFRDEHGLPAGAGDAANIIWEVERFLHMLHALPDYADFPTASASSQGHDGHLPRVPDVVQWFFDYGVAKFTSSRAITRRPRGCWGWRVAKVSGQARLGRTMLPWPSQKFVPSRHGLGFAGGCEPSSAAGRAIAISKMHTHGVVFMGGRRSSSPALPE